MNYRQARDAMFSIFNEVWQPRHAVWTDLPSDIPESGVWARVTLRHENGEQASLTGGIGTILYDNTGTLFIQVFTPIGQGSTENYDLCDMLVSAYRKANKETWFRNVRMQEVGSTGNFQQHNVLIDFTYTKAE